MNSDALTLAPKFAAELGQAITGEKISVSEMLSAMDRKDRSTAQKFFELLCGWNRLRELLEICNQRFEKPEALTLVVDSWFLQDLVKYLTPGRDEEISYVTGVSIGNLRVLSRICGVKLAKQSPVYALATAASCADALVEIIERGNSLHVMAHSHPGRGAKATTPSGIDTNYLGRVQKTGADVIGIIVTRDHFVRFFTVDKPFNIRIQGNHIQQVEQFVYKLKAA